MARVKHRYFGDAAIGRETLYNLCDGLSDEMMFHPIWRTIQMFMRAKHDQVYFFQYSHENEYDWASTIGMGDDPKIKAGHFDEVILQFTNKVRVENAITVFVPSCKSVNMICCFRSFQHRKKAAVTIGSLRSSGGCGHSLPSMEILR